MDESNPLSEARPESLDELMSRMPVRDEDLPKIVAHLREAAKQWQQAEIAGAKKAPKTKVSGLTLADLGLVGKPK